MNEHSLQRPGRFDRYTRISEPGDTHTTVVAMINEAGMTSRPSGFIDVGIALLACI